MRKMFVIGWVILLGLGGCIKAIPNEGPYTIDHTGQLPEGRYEVNTHPYYGVGYVFDLADDPEFEGLDVYVVHNEMELALLMAIHIDQLSMDLYYVEDKALDYDRVWMYLNALEVNDYDGQYGEIDVPKDDPTATIMTVEFTYDLSRINTVENTIDAWTSDLKSHAYDDHDQAEQILMTLLENVEYDEAALNDNDRLEDAFTAMGVFKDGQAVCNGYSQAYMGLLKDLDIPAMMVGSDIDDHAWNMVYVDGMWSYVDATWEDETYATTDYWVYFLIDQQTLELDHSWDSGSFGTLNAQDYLNFAYYAFPQTKTAHK